MTEIAGLNLVSDSWAGARGVWPVLVLRLKSAQMRDALLHAQWGAG